MRHVMLLPRMVVATMLCLSVAVPSASFALDLDVSNVNTSVDTRTGRPMIEVLLTDRSRRDYATFTLENLGRSIDVRIDGKVVMSPIVREPQVNGRVFLVSSAVDWTYEFVRDLAVRLGQPGAKIEVVATK